MTAQRRVGLAFCSLLVSFTLFSLIITIPSLVAYGTLFLRSNVEALPLYLLFAIPGVLLALPFVLLFKDAEGWRAWAILALGSAIGPGFWESWSMLESHGHFSWQGDGLAIVFSLMIGVPTTVVYVLLLRRFDRMRRRAGTAETDPLH